MNKFEYKGFGYGLKELIELRTVSPLYRTGDVIDLQTHEVLDISEIDKWREDYFEDLINKKDKKIYLNKMNKSDKIKLYERKYSENRISKEELYELIKLKDKNYLEIKYDDFLFVNIGKNKPKEVSVSDYGRFMLLLDYISWYNKIQHISNGRKIKESALMEKLEIKAEKTLHNFISKLSKYGMLSKSGHGDKRFIHINPVYARRKIKIDQTLYDLFKDDLQEYLSEYEIAYFEMCTGGENMDATIEIVSDKKEKD